VRRARGIAAWGLAAVLLVGGTAWAVAAIRHHLIYGTVFDEKALRPRIERGERFSLAVPDRGASVGDEWSATVSPDAVLRAHGDRQVMNDPIDRLFGSHIGGLFGPHIGGGEGTRYFTYVAGRTGTVTVQLTNCFQGLCHSGRIDPWSRAVTWTITVT